MTQSMTIQYKLNNDINGLYISNITNILTILKILKKNIL